MRCAVRICAKNTWTICVLSCKIKVIGLGSAFVPEAKTALFISPSILSVGGVIFLANSNSNRYLLGFAWLDSALVL